MFLNNVQADRITAFALKQWSDVATSTWKAVTESGEIHEVQPGAEHRRGRGRRRDRVEDLRPVQRRRHLRHLRPVRHGDRGDLRRAEGPGPGHCLRRDRRRPRWRRLSRDHRQGDGRDEWLDRFQRTGRPRHTAYRRRTSTASASPACSPTSSVMRSTCRIRRSTARWATSAPRAGARISTRAFPAASRRCIPGATPIPAPTGWTRSTSRRCSPSSTRRRSTRTGAIRASSRARSTAPTTSRPSRTCIRRPATRRPGAPSPARST